MADVLGARISQRQKFDKQKWFHKNGQENPACTQKTGRRNQHSWKEHNRPSFMRLDSAGENSASSCEDLNGAFSPEILPSNHCRPRFQEQEPRPFTETRQSGGLLDKVKSALGTSARNQYLPPRRNGTRHLARHTSSNNSDARLASLDSVAEKFTNMSMPKVNPQAQHWGNPMPNWQQHSNGSPAYYGAQGHWGRTANDPHDRNHAPIFHPYQGMNQPPLLSSTQNYQRNFYSQPWQQMMGGNCPPYPPFTWGFNQFAPPPHWQQQQQQRSHPPFPYQQWLGPQMMQGHGNQGPMTRQQRAQSPAKRQKWNNQHGNRQRTCPQSKSRCHVDQSKSSSTQAPVQATSYNESSVDQSVNFQKHIITEVKSDEISSKEETTVDTKKNVECEVSDSAIYSPENLVKTEQDEEHIAIQNENMERQTSCLTAKKEQDSEDTCITIKNENIDHQKPEVSRVHDRPTDKTESEAVERHSTIDLILADYESSTPDKVTALSYSSDSEDSYGDSDSAVETNADLWESFTVSDDPYNPLCGWRCSEGIQEVLPGAKASIRDCHVDSGTDEGDWSETDSDDDYDSGDDSPVDDVDTSLHRSFKLSDPQLQELRDNLSSTPKAKTDSASAHHPSVAFILGSTSSSSEDEDGDWDTLDDPSSLQGDPLWDSFNRARDPYSPMEAWKFRDSNLSSPVAPSSPSQTTPMRKDSVEGLRTLLLTPTEQKETLPRSCEELSPRDSDGENFAIATVRIHAARDDFGLGLRKPVACEVAMKRVSSASCLRRIQLTPKDKATKKVRFCPNSSFIVLVEKDLTSCENNPSLAAGNDWQACARDRMRFKARIDQLSLILDPVLTNAHREQVYASQMAGGGCR